MEKDLPTVELRFDEVTDLSVWRYHCSNRADRVTSCGVLIDDEDVSALKAMAADCVVIAVDHPGWAASEVIADGDFCVEPTAEALAKQLDAALGGTRPLASPAEHT